MALLSAASVGVIAAAAVSATPAHADPLGDSFLSALNNAGVAYNNPGNAVALGQSVCPMLAQPGGTFASAASSVTGSGGMSPQMAGLFTTIAISMFCPAMVSSIANGNIPNVPGGNGLPIPGVNGFQVPGVPGL
jgi:hypothetical protein